MISISVWNPKGGVGKSTVALALASAFAASGQRVQLIDLDPQGGSMLWAELVRRDEREPAFTVATQAAQGHDVTIYDHQPGLPHHGVLPGQIVVVPTPLDVMSLAPTLRGVEEIRAMGKPYLIVPNRVEVSSVSQSTALVKQFGGGPHIRKRVAFQRLYDTGYALYDTGSGVPLVGAARADFAPVMSAIIKLAKGLAQR